MRRIAPILAMATARGVDVRLGPPKTVLVVEDDSLLRWSVRCALESRFAVLEAADGASALLLLERHDVDLVLTDLKMEGMSGWELIAEIRRRGFRVKIIACTACGVPEVDGGPAVAGADAVLPKPVPLGEIVDAVRIHVNS